MTGGVLGAALELQSALEAEGIAFCFIGAVALQRWGEPRYTQDLDIQVVCPFGDELGFVERIAPIVPPRIERPERLASEGRVYLGRIEQDIPVDIALAGVAYELRVHDRATREAVAPETTLRICSAEDLVIMKSFAGRDRDWGDVASVVARCGEALDWDLIERELPELLALRDETTLPEKLVRLRGS